mgnify:CR=1 FL=1
MTKVKQVDIFPWNKSLETGIDKIDEQHKKLVSLVNKIACRVISEATPEMFNETLEELAAYTEYHFSTEEEIWSTYFPMDTGLKAHIKAHKNFVNSVVDLKSSYSSKPSNEAIEKILSLLTHWLTHHILDNDMRMALTIGSINAGMSLKNAQEQADRQMSGVMSIILQTSLLMYDSIRFSALELNREVHARAKVEEKLKKEILKRQKIEREFEYLALHDELTELPNRRFFEKLCNAALLTAKRANHKHAILFLDLDGFKNINDLFGHNVGDELLVSVAKRLKKCVRESDVVARMGGDEFIIFLADDCKKEGVEKISSEIISLISSPFELITGDVNIGGSVGISIYPDDGDNVGSLLQNADQAMYEAKRSGKNKYLFYGQSL